MIVAGLAVFSQARRLPTPGDDEGAAMNDAATNPSGGEPGHYGPGYGEKPTDEDDAAAVAPAPSLETAIDAPAGLEPLTRRLDPDAPGAKP
jgi:hypothetical protein